MERVISYAQNREDLIIKAFFPDITEGFYVDVGANHPIYESVTKRFYDEGWSGINIEPNLRLNNLLMIERPRDINLAIGVSDKEGILTFREYAVGDGLSTFSTSMKEQYTKYTSQVTEAYEDRKVQVKTLAAIFSEQGVKHIHFMKVDVEGYEYEVLRGNNWERYRPELICIEANHTQKDWHKLLTDSHYVKVFFDGLNEYYIAKEASHRKELFSHPEAILLKDIVVPYRVEEYIEELQEQNQQALLKETTLNAEIYNLTNQILELEKEIELRNGIKYHTVSLAHALDRYAANKINKLQKTATPKTYKSTSPGTLSNKTSQELLYIARLSDIQNYYTDDKPPKNYIYRIVKGTYVNGKRSLKTVAKAGYKTAKRLRAKS